MQSTNSREKHAIKLITHILQPLPGPSTADSQQRHDPVENDMTLLQFVCCVAWLVSTSIDFYYLRTGFNAIVQR
jgi:hypothetical protein